MQRTFVAIALALTLSCASASYIATQNYVKGPIQVVQDNETNFTSANGSLTLGSVNAGELDIIGSNYTLAPQPNATTPGNLSATSWVSTYRKLDGKSLSASTNTSLAFTSATGVGYSNGYALAFSVDNDTGIPQLYSYQTKVTGGNTIKFNVTSNKDASYQPMPAAIGAIGKNIYVFYVTSSAGTQVNVTNFAIGGTAKGSLEFTLTTTFNSSLQVVWGESLGSNQLYANWLAGTTPALTYATVDVSKGSATATAATAWGSNYSCTPFATDKKWYGDLCYFTNGTSVAEKTINYYIRFNGTALVPKTNVSLNATTQRFANVFPYGPYIAVIYSDSVATQGNNTYSYEIFNLDSWSATKNSTVFLTTDSSSWSFFRVVSGGLYTLTSQAQYTNTSLPTYSSVQVGLVLGSSYLTSVLGFIMTIVAGVLLF